MPLLATRVPLQASYDPALPGLAVLCRPAEVTAMLSRRLAASLAPAHHRRVSPGRPPPLARGNGGGGWVRLGVGRANRGAPGSPGVTILFLAICSPWLDGRSL